MHFMTSMQYFPLSTEDPIHSCSSFTRAEETALWSDLGWKMEI